MHWLHQDYPLMNLSRWAAATSLGMLIVTPGLLILRQSVTDPSRPPVSKAGLVALGVLVLVSVAAFGQTSYDLRYLVPPALALVAIYLEFLGVAVGGLMVAIIAVIGAFLHKGVFSSLASDPAQRILLTQLFVGFVMAVNLPFAALLVQRRRMRETLLRTKLEAEAAQAAVVEQQRRSNMAEEIAKVGFWRADFRTGRVEWSDQNYAIFGRDPSEPLDLGTLDSHVHPEDREGRAAAWSQLRFGEPTMSSWRIVRQDGGVRHVVKRGVPEFDANGLVCGAFGTVVDVTELAQAQEALAQSNAQLRLITQTVADIIVQTDLDDRITFISPSVEARLGYKPDEVLGSKWVSLLHCEDAPVWTAALEQLLKMDDKNGGDFIHCRAPAKDGREIWLALRPALVRDSTTGEPIGVVDIARDVTERNRMFGELKAAQAAAEKASAIKGEFLANMSHEIRTPLTSISGFTKLVESQGDLSEDTRRYVGHISAAASALVAIVNDVLDFSKLEAGEIRTEQRPTDVQAVMRDTVNLFSGRSQEKGLSLTLDYPLDAPALLMVDPDRLRQVLINLAGNGLKFTEQGGVRLVAAYDAASERLKIEVIDTGPGVPADRMSALFQRFSQIEGPATRKFGGTGLGLAISKGLVEAMGGEIGVSSQEGDGACFWFTIPAVPAQLPLKPISVP
jgi:PAS domain S-box-containing protein